MKRMKVRPRKVNLETVRTEGGKMIYPGDSLHTVPCPNNISKGMRQNLRAAARGSLVVDFERRTGAWNVMKECKITTKRLKKRNRRKAS